MHERTIVPAVKAPCTTSSNSVLFTYYHTISVLNSAEESIPTNILATAPLVVKRRQSINMSKAGKLALAAKRSPIITKRFASIPTLPQLTITEATPAPQIMTNKERSPTCNALQPSLSKKTIDNYTKK